MTSAAERFSRAARGWIFIGALAQAVLPGVVSVIHASTAAGAFVARLRPHAEDPSTAHHPPIHQEDTCGLCQIVSGLFTPTAQPAGLPLLRSKSLDVIRGEALAPEWLTDGSPSLPRAPPVEG